MKLGKSIIVGGVRPAWLRDTTDCVLVGFDSGYIRRVDPFLWAEIRCIYLPADHEVYGDSETVVWTPERDGHAPPFWEWGPRCGYYRADKKFRTGGRTTTPDWQAIFLYTVPRRAVYGVVQFADTDAKRPIADLIAEIRGREAELRACDEITSLGIADAPFDYEAWLPAYAVACGPGTGPKLVSGLTPSAKMRVRALAKAFKLAPKEAK